MSSQTNKSERGIALIIVLFSLLLLSVIGLGMMYSTNMETSINSNYRDKQVAFYAALAGLQEARDRIIPRNPLLAYSIAAPTALPSTSAQNIIYIVADSTVKPWDNTNAYFDTELCQENVLGATGTPGVPCSGTGASAYPTGSGWYSVVYNNASTSAPYNLANPLDLKWTRIELKGNNMTPVPVNGNSASTDETCWTGAFQMSTPTGYTTGCQPTGGVTAVTVVTSGSGYTSVPTVSFSGGGPGTGVAATAVLSPETTGYVQSIAVTNGGSGYTTAPAVTVSASAGTTATATAVLSSTGTTTTTGGSVVSVSLTTGGSGYTTAPTIVFGGPGSGASATAVLGNPVTTTTGGSVSTVTLTTGGAATYTSAPTVTFTGSGSGAAATATLATSGVVTSVTSFSAGTHCYLTAGEATVTFSSGTATGAAVLDTTRSCVHDVSFSGMNNGTNKCSTAISGTTQSDVSFSIGKMSGTSVSGTLTVGADHKSMSSFVVHYPGHDTTNYTAATLGTPTLSLIAGSWAGGGNCSNAGANPVNLGYRIASIQVTASGSSYTTAPTVTIGGGIGDSAGTVDGVTQTNATATPVLGFQVGSITLTSGGSGYATAPTVGFTGGGGSGAAATSTTTGSTSVTTYSVTSITFNLANGGNGYTSAPGVTFSGGGGSLAAATAAIATTTLTTYPVDHIDVNNGGTGYSSVPTVMINGGGGSLAAATATIATMNTGTSYISAININSGANGSGYTSNPTVTITGGGGTTVATATSQVSGGTKFGQVYLLTSFAQTRNGARAMLQMEVASPVLGFALGGALTLDGPNPVIDAMPNSMGFTVTGADANSCSGTAEPTHPAIDGYDDPNASPPTNSVTTITNSLPRPDHYTGSGGTPSVQNGYAALGETMTTVNGLQSLLGQIFNATPAASRYTTATSGSFSPNSTTKSSITFVDGDLTLSGNPSGSGILVVTGTLEMKGNFTWHGLVLVIGDGVANMSGGGNADITGSIIVSKIWDDETTKNYLGTIGSPTFSWNGGGGNGIHYDHCYADNLMTAVPFIPPGSTNPLKALSFRILPY